MSIVVDWQNVTGDEGYYSGGCGGLCSTAQGRLCEGMLEALKSAVRECRLHTPWLAYPVSLYVWGCESVCKGVWICVHEV